MVEYPHGTMVKTCCVARCCNKADKKIQETGVSFYRFPVNTKKRDAWIRAINRKGWIPNDHSYICSSHFVDGWHSDDPADDNYIPTLFCDPSMPKTPQKIQQRDCAKRERACTVKVSERVIMAATR